jgi:hypothetical protein
MTAALLWVLRLLIIYFIIKFGLSALGLKRKNPPRRPRPDKTIHRFDDKNKNVSDGDFKDL